VNEVFSSCLQLFPVSHRIFAPVNEGFSYRGPLNVALDLINRGPTCSDFNPDYLLYLLSDEIMLNSSGDLHVHRPREANHFIIGKKPFLVYFVYSYLSFFCAVGWRLATPSISGPITQPSWWSLPRGHHRPPCT
jgi:hypothetical protein